MPSMTIAWARVPAPAPLVELTVGVTDDGVLCLSFHDGERELARVARRTGRRLVEDPSLTADVVEQLSEYFGGERQHVDVAVDWSLSGGATRQVLRTLHSEVGFGATTTYGELAIRSGAFVGADGVLGARAVGSIMGANPVPVIVACHRVLAAGGLGGFGGGLPAKRWLLELEGALPPTLDL